MPGCCEPGQQSVRQEFRDWPITRRFVTSPNGRGLTIGAITDVGKRRWEHLWGLNAEAEDATSRAIVKKPIAVYVETAYEEGDLSGLGI